MVYLIKNTEHYYGNDNELKRLNLGENLSGHLIQPNSAVLRYPSVQFELPQVMFAPCSPWKAFHGLLEPFVEVSGLVSHSPPSCVSNQQQFTNKPGRGLCSSQCMVPLGNLGGGSLPSPAAFLKALCWQELGLKWGVLAAELSSSSRACRMLGCLLGTENLRFRAAFRLLVFGFFFCLLQSSCSGAEQNRWAQWCCGGASGNQEEILQDPSPILPERTYSFCKPKPFHDSMKNGHLSAEHGRDGGSTCSPAGLGKREKHSINLGEQPTRQSLLCCKWNWETLAGTWHMAAVSKQWVLTVP